MSLGALAERTERGGCCAAVNTEGLGEGDTMCCGRGGGEDELTSVSYTMGHWQRLCAAAWLRGLVGGRWGAGALSKQ